MRMLILLFTMVLTTLVRLSADEHVGPEKMKYDGYDYQTPKKFWGRGPASINQLEKTPPPLPRTRAGVGGYCQNTFGRPYYLGDNGYDDCMNNSDQLTQGPFGRNKGVTFIVPFGDGN